MRILNAMQRSERGNCVAAVLIILGIIFLVLLIFACGAACGAD